MTAPPPGAGAVSVTVPVETLPKIIVAGFMATPASAAGPAGFTVSVAVLATPLYLAVRVTAVGTATTLVVTGNVFVVAPAATVTEAGTVAALVLLLVNATTAPPAGAAALSVTVPVLFARPPVTVAGFSVIEASTGTIFTMKPSFPPAGSGCTSPATGRGLGAGGTG